MANPQPNKDTIYVDVDDEITAIIDKVRASSGRIVALVLPKRASVLQSVVNMKLLKRSSEKASKQLVLITSEAGLLPLAGAVGLYVADSLQSKPEIPAVPNQVAPMGDEEVVLDDEEYTADTAGDQPVGVLADKTGTGLVISSSVDTEDVPTTSAAGAAVAAKAKAAGPKSKKLRVPNFNKFRVLLALGVLGVLLLIGLIYFLVAVLPKAKIEISTNAQDVNSSLNVSLDTTASKVDVAKAIVPATAVQQQKTYTKQVDATGKENLGDTSKGSITMTACSAAPVSNVPTGTGVSAAGKTYITQEKAKFSNTGSYDFGNGCWKQQTNSVAITAQSAGADYNMADGTKFTVNGRSDITATGSTSGGTDDIRQVVSQSDIDNAQGQINTNDSAIKEALYQQLTQDGLFGIRATFKASKPTVSSSSQVGDEASTVTVTSAITYTMYGTKRDNLVQLVTDDVNNQVDTSKQGIIDDGIDKASFSYQDGTDTVARVEIAATATVGPKIDIDTIRQQVAGKKSGDAKDIINQIPGVTNVDIKLSPFWLTSIPSNPSKITVHVGKAAPAQSGS
jgi:hypothetical protein